MSNHPLAELFNAAARGNFPAPDGTVAVYPPPGGTLAAVVAFTAHHVIVADLPPSEVLERLPSDDLGAPMSPPFLWWLAQRLRARPGMLDVVLAHLGDGAPKLELVRLNDRADHPRVARALRQRQEVAVYSDPEGRGVVTLGRGLAGRWEVSVEVEPTHRASGLGRSLIGAVRALVPSDDPVFAQVSPGNSASLRAFLAAGFRPIGAEVLFFSD